MPPGFIGPAELLASLSSGTRLPVPGTWTPSAHPGKRRGPFSSTCSEEAGSKVAIILPGSQAVYMYAL